MTSSTMSRRGAAWVWGLAILSGLALLVLFLLPFYFQYQLQNEIYAMQEDLSPEDRALLTRFQESPLDFPEGWTKAEPYSDELKAAVREAAPDILRWSETEYLPDASEVDGISKRVHEGSETIYLKKILKGESLNPTELAKANVRIHSASPLRAKLDRLIQIPDYELNAVFSSSIHPDLEYKREFLRRASKQYCLEFAIASMVSPGSEDILILLKPLDLVRSHPASWQHHVRAALEIPMLVAATTRIWATRTEDKVKLRNVLDGMNNRRKTRFSWATWDEVLLLAGGPISELRERIRGGEDLHFKPGEPAKYYLSLWGGLLGGNPLNNAVGQFIAETMVMGEIRNARSVASYAKNALQDYDLALLTLASRIRFLETGKLETDSAAFVPEFFEKPLLDPVTEAPYRFNAETGKFEAQRVPRPQWNSGEKPAEESSPDDPS